MYINYASRRGRGRSLSYYPTLRKANESKNTWRAGGKA
jgi:hypothetical protein